MFTINKKDTRVKKNTTSKYSEVNGNVIGKWPKFTYLA